MKERNYAIDYLKFFAIFAVILIHAGPFEEVTLLGVDGYYIDFIIDTLSRFAVPFFFVTSGYLFGKKMQTAGSNSVYFSGYISKLSKLFISWFVFYLLYDFFVNVTFKSSDLASGRGMIQFMEENINLEVFFYGASTGYQLWYLVALIWSIFILYIFIHIDKLNLLLFISLGLNIFGLFGQSYSGFFSLPFGTRDAIFFGLFYTTLGAFAAYNEETIKYKITGVPTKGWLLLSFLFSILLAVERMVTVFLFEGEIGDYFLLTIPVTICLFLYALSNPSLGKGSLLTKIGKESVGIYVIHVFFIKIIHLLTDVAGVSSMKEHLIWHILFSPVVFLLSYLSYGILQKIKQRMVYTTIKRLTISEWKY